MKRKLLFPLAILAMTVTSCGGGGSGPGPNPPDPGPVIVPVDFADLGSKLVLFNPLDQNLTINFAAGKYTATLRCDEGKFDYLFSDALAEAYLESYQREEFEDFFSGKYYELTNYDYSEGMDYNKYIYDDKNDVYIIEQVEHASLSRFANYFGLYMVERLISEYKREEPHYDVKYDTINKCYILDSYSFYFNEHNELDKFTYDDWYAPRNEHDEQRPEFIKSTVSIINRKSTKVVLPENVEVDYGFEYELNEEGTGYIIVSGYPDDDQDVRIPDEHLGLPVVGFDDDYLWWFKQPLLTLGKNIKYFEVRQEQLRVTATSEDTVIANPYDYDVEIVYPGETSKIYLEDHLAYTYDEYSGDKVLLAILSSDCSLVKYNYDEQEEGGWTLTVPGEYVQIDGRLLYHIGHMDNVIFKEGVKYIYGSDTFSRTNKVSLPDSLIYVNCNFFYPYYNFYPLEHATIENGLYYLGNENNPYVLLAKRDQDYDYGKSITLPEGCKVVAYHAFYDEDLEEVELPSVQGIMEGAFYMNNIKNLILGSDFIYFDSNCFTFSYDGYTCEFSASDIEIGLNVGSSLPLAGHVTIDNDGCQYFGSDSNPYMVLIEIPSDMAAPTYLKVRKECKYISTINDNFERVYPDTDFVIPETVKLISIGSFRYTSFKSTTFEGKTKVNLSYTFALDTPITIEGEHPEYTENNHMILGKHGTHLVRFDKSQKEVHIPSKVTLLGDIYADGNGTFFEGLDKVYYEGTLKDWLTKVTNTNPIPTDFYINDDLVDYLSFPSDIKEIRTYAFIGVKSLVSVNLEGIEEIDSYAFEKCSSLKEVDIADSVTYLSYGCFGGIEPIEKVTIGKGLVNASEPFKGSDIIIMINNSVLSYLDMDLEIDDIFIYVAGEECDARVVENGIFTLVYNEEEVWLYSMDFREVEEMEEVVIPEGVTHIASNVIKGYPCCQSIIMPESLEHVNSYAFVSYYHTIDLVFPESEAYYEKMNTFVDGDCWNYNFNPVFEEHVHDWGDWEETTPVIKNGYGPGSFINEGAYQDGEMTRTCKTCGESETKTIEVYVDYDADRSDFTAIVEAFDLMDNSKLTGMNYSYVDASDPSSLVTDTFAKGSPLFEEYYNEWFFADSNVLDHLEEEYGDRLVYWAVKDQDGNVYMANLVIYDEDGQNFIRTSMGVISSSPMQQFMIQTMNSKNRESYGFGFMFLDI